MKTNYELLTKIAEKHGYTVGTLITNASNFYQNAVLYVAIGSPVNRNSHRVCETWDISYSARRNSSSLRNKLGRAVRAAIFYVLRHKKHPDLISIDKIELARRCENRKQYRIKNAGNC